LSIHLKVNKKLERFLTTSKPLKIAVGGRGSGKSIAIGDMLTFKMATEQADIYCLREYQDSISDSVHRVLKGSVVDRIGLEGWDIQENKIVAPNGAQTAYKGAARNPDSIQSAQGYKYSWFEEAHRASQTSLDKLLPTILRNPGAECWFSANPQSSADAFSKRFINPYLSELEANGFYEDDLHLIVVVNWRDNPWWNDEQEALRSWDYANLSRAKYDWIWEGKFNDQVEDSTIKAEWFDAAVDAHEKLNITPTGAVVASHDPADEGNDSKAYAIRKGILFTDVGEIDAPDGNESCDIATAKAIDANADLFVWDADGMGALLRRQIGESFEGIKCELRAYRGSHEVEDKKAMYDGLGSLGNSDKPKTNGDTFYNKRAQYGIKLAQRFYNTYQAVNGKYTDPDTLISISSDIKLLGKLRSEVCRVPTKPNGAGKIQLMSKVDMKKKYGIDSPGMYDCLVMAQELPTQMAAHKKINFQAWG